MFLLLKSTNIKWLSVPPDTRSKPLSVRPFASACAFATMFLPYSWNSGDKASLKQTALDAITCINGPPWIPGKTALLSLCSKAISSLERISPPLGPLNVL